MRLDKYLKISRLIKRRTVANEACDAGKILVNDKVARASYDVKAGDVIAVKESSRSSEKFKALAESAATHHAPKWLEVKADAFTAKVTALPAREDVDFDFNEQLIVELYSK